MTRYRTNSLSLYSQMRYCADAITHANAQTSYRDNTLTYKRTNTIYLASKGVRAMTLKSLCFLQLVDIAASQQPVFILSVFQ